MKRILLVLVVVGLLVVSTTSMAVADHFIVRPGPFPNVAPLIPNK